jgi:hypothetical protein
MIYLLCPGERSPNLIVPNYIRIRACRGEKEYRDIPDDLMITAFHDRQPAQAEA